MCLCICLFFVLNARRVLNGSAPNLARGIHTFCRWSWGLASAASACELALGELELAGATEHA